MARDSVSLTALSANGGTAEPAGVDISPTNGAVIAAPGDCQRLLLRVTNTAGADKAVTIKAGVNPPAFRKDLGDLAVTVAATTGVQYIVVESARFVQADGTINVDFAAAMTGKITALKLPAV